MKERIGLSDILAALDAAAPCIRKGCCMDAVDCLRRVGDLLSARLLDPLDRMILRKALTRLRYILETENADTPAISGALRALEIRICA